MPTAPLSCCFAQPPLIGKLLSQKMGKLQTEQCNTILNHLSSYTSCRIKLGTTHYCIQNFNKHFLAVMHIQYRIYNFQWIKRIRLCFYILCCCGVWKIADWPDWDANFNFKGPLLLHCSDFDVPWRDDASRFWFIKVVHKCFAEDYVFPVNLCTALVFQSFFVFVVFVPVVRLCLNGFRMIGMQICLL